jgi:hypothetical protein
MVSTAMRDEDVRRPGIERLGRLNWSVEAIQRMRVGFLFHPVDGTPQHIEGPTAGIRVMAQALRHFRGRRAQRRVQDVPRHDELVTTHRSSATHSAIGEASV